MDISELAMSARELFEPLAAQNGVTINTSIAGPTVVHGDLQRLQRVVSNVFENGLWLSLA